MRDFGATPEPDGTGVSAGGRRQGRQPKPKAKTALSFVVQKHAARRLHYDFRLELAGTLKSWAVPKGPSLDPTQRRMAVRVEDHPLDYAGFEGEIPRGHYGAGKVIVWDRGYWQPLDEDAEAALGQGKLKFSLEGEKLNGGFTLVRLRGRPDERQESWLLIKERDEAARAEDGVSIVDERPESVLRKASSRAEKSRQQAAPKTQSGGKRQPVPAGATPADLPTELAPALATLVRSLPNSGEWNYEVKFDGYRLLGRVAADQSVRLFTRNGHDWSARLPALVRSIQQMQIGPAWIDGEIVMLGDDGAPDFQALQNAFETRRVNEIRYFLFDLPFHDGYDLRKVPVRERRARLRALLESSSALPANIQFSEDFEAEAEDLLSSACDLRLEGLIAKRADSPYATGRTTDWIKLKCALGQEFVVGGYTDPQGTRDGFGSLLLGVYDGEHLRYVGNVGTGFGRSSLKTLHAKLVSLEQARSPFAGRPPARARVHWVAPELVVEVAFGAWTKEGRVRHAVFKGLRADKPPSSIRRETAGAVPEVGGGKRAAKAKGTVATARSTAEAPPEAPAKDKSRTGRPTAGAKAGRAAKRTTDAPTIRITSPERVVDPASGATKRQLIDYCQRAADLLLQHLDKRPVSLLRAPAGVNEKQFFQKHANARTLREITRLDPAIDRDHEPLLAIDTEVALLSAAQMNVVEFHTWNATTRAIEKPDRMVFDLDPGEGVEWTEVVEGALVVNDFLDALGLRAFLKASGGRGVHLVVPLVPRLGWQDVKDFSRNIVEYLSGQAPDRFVAKSGPKNRVGKIFIDYLRNGRGATTVCAFSPRARPGLPISLPLTWDELPDLRSNEIATIFTERERLERAAEAWSDYDASRQSLARAMKKLGK